VNLYQTLFILASNLTEEELKVFEEKLNKALAKLKFEVKSFEKIGKRDLATYFDHHKTGIYIRLTFNGEGAVPNAIATFARNNAEVVRQLTSRVEMTKEELVATA
jgi:small subunit ribosomal protein S6